MPVHCKIIDVIKFQLDVKKKFFFSSLCFEWMPGSDHRMLQRHNENEHFENKIKCNFCQSQNIFRDPKNYLLHVRRSHLMEVESWWKKCQNCSDLFPTFDLLEIHERAVHLTVQRAMSQQKLTMKELKQNSTENNEQINVKGKSLGVAK